jgi:hypothetical protein
MLTNSVDKVYILASSVKKEAAKAEIAVDGAIGSPFFQPPSPSDVLGSFS